MINPRHSDTITKEQALRWFLEFGTDWVSGDRLEGTWADYDLYWQICARNGWLETTEFLGKLKVRITQQALDLFMKEGDQNVSVS